MSRQRLLLLAPCPVLVLPAVLAAQEPLEAQQGEPPERIDIRVDTQPEAEAYQDCEDDQDAATITGEIIVCRERRGDENRLYDHATAVRRHAEETAFRDDPKTPDFIRDCQDQGWPVGCVKLGSAPPPAYIVDFSELPDTPPGSDADRIARGLAPRGRSDLDASGATIIAEEELGLPPPLDTSEQESEDEVSPSGSASPEEEPSG